jgi:hypothetical protein
MLRALTHRLLLFASGRGCHCRRIEGLTAETKLRQQLLRNPLLLRGGHGYGSSLAFLLVATVEEPGRGGGTQS